MISESDTTFWLIDSQLKIKTLTKLFTYLISKNIEDIHFDYTDGIFTLNSNSFLSNKLMEFSIRTDFFSKCKINDKSLLTIPILSVIKDLKSYKGKKIFPDVYFIFKHDSFLIHSIYDNFIELSSITSKTKEIPNSNVFKLETIMQNKQPDVTFILSIEKLNILINNTYVKENSELRIQDEVVILIFDDTHGNQKVMRCDISTNTLNDNTLKHVIIENFILKDLIKFFKDNNVTIGIYMNEEKITYDLDLGDSNIKFKLVSHLSLRH